MVKGFQNQPPSAIVVPTPAVDEIHDDSDSGMDVVGADGLAPLQVSRLHRFLPCASIF
jgi:hypothetical protein